MLELQRKRQFMFKEIGSAPAAGMFGWSHFGLLAIFGVLAFIFFRLSRKWEKAKIMRCFKVYSLVLVAMEIFKIGWNIYQYGLNIDNLNNFVPLYYCSLFLYAFVLIAWSKGKVLRASYAWLIYGGLIAGVSFLIYPSSSLLLYPGYHFLSIHSILFHASLVLISVMVIYHQLYIPSPKDFVPFLVFSLVFMTLAFIINKTVGTNLMFLEDPLAIQPFTWLQNISQPLFEIFMFLAQLFLPFVFTHWIFLALSRFTNLKVYKNRDN